jgi:hypothetical protein
MHSGPLQETYKRFARFQHGLIRLLVLILTASLCILGDENLKQEFLRQNQKLNRETSPVGKVKVLIRIASLHLQSVSHALKSDDFLQADRSLVQYKETIGQALETLKTSGRNAQKNPAGFKEFEISLRKQLRLLDDLKSRYSFDEIETIDRAIQTAKSAQEEMFEQIFGAENTGRRSEKKDPSPVEKP